MLELRRTEAPAQPVRRTAATTTGAKSSPSASDGRSRTASRRRNDPPAYRRRRDGRRRRRADDDRGRGACPPPPRQVQVPAGRRQAADRGRARQAPAACAVRPKSSTATTWCRRRKADQALRRAKTTSMGLAVDAVKRGEAGAAVSAGNTGALMAMSKLALRTMPGIDRPALAALLPTLGENDVVMLDLGANSECDARNLVQFAIMGAAYSRIVNGTPRPRVRLLNIGTEETKGTDAAAGRGRRAQGRQRPRARLRRLHRGRQDQPRHLRRDRHRRVFGQHRAEGDRGRGAVRDRPAAQRLLLQLPLEDRLPGLAPRDRAAASITSIPTTTTARSSSASTAWW